MDDFLKSLSCPWNGASKRGKGWEVRRLHKLCIASAVELTGRWSGTPTEEQSETLKLMRSPGDGKLLDLDKEIQRMYDLCRKAAWLAGAPRDGEQR